MRNGARRSRAVVAGSNGGSKPRDAPVPQLDVAAAVRAAGEGAAGSGVAELVGVHGDLGFASATL